MTPLAALEGGCRAGAPGGRDPGGHDGGPPAGSPQPENPHRHVGKHVVVLGASLDRLLDQGATSDEIAAGDRSGGDAA